MTLDDAQGELIKQADIKVGVGAPTVSEVKSWIDQQIPYENFAGKIGSFDTDVLQWAEEIRTTYQQRMAKVFERWAQNQAVANGESMAGEYEDDVHVPETYKMVQGKVAHVEEQLFSFDPPFMVAGVKDDMSRMQALMVSSYVQRMLEQAGYKGYIRPVATDIELTGMGAVKVLWERVLEEIVERKVDYFWRGNKTYMSDERRLKRVLVTDGPMLQQVDPFRLIIDLEAGQIKDCLWIGDESDQAMHTLERKAELGLFSKEQVAQLGRYYQYAPAGNAEPNFHDILRRSRSILSNWSSTTYSYTNQYRSARRLKVLDLWGFYDFRDGYDGVNHPDGRKIQGVQRIVVTVAARTVLQVRLNPFDKKFAPYGVGRVNPNGHEMISVGPIDNMIGTNAQYDRYQSAVLRHADLSVDPIIIATNTTDLPDTMLGVRAGKIFRNPGDFKEVKVSDLPSSAQYMHSYFRRECEELSGNLRTFETQPNTATEIGTKVQEQNRLLRPDIRANSDLWRQVALICYRMSGQFASDLQRFKVSGKAAKMLGQFSFVTPDMLQDEIDISFVGAESMQSHAQKGSGMVQWMNEWAPLLPTIPSISIENLAMLTFEHQVGPDLLDQVFKGKIPEWMLWPQEDENWMLLRGQKVSVNDEDDHKAHMEDMETRGLVKLAMDKTTPAPVTNAILDHYHRHGQKLQQQIQQQQAEMINAQRKSMLMGAGAGGTPGIGAPAAPGGMEAKAGPPGGNPPQDQGPGVTNGPMQNRTVARSGRNGAGISQTQRMGTQG